MKTFSSAVDFRKSLETRLLVHAKKSQSDIQRLRRKVGFDRFLARLYAEREPKWILKGGYSLELKYPYARSTKDIDLNLYTSQEALQLDAQVIMAFLKRCVAKDLNDHFIFKIENASLELDGAPEGGYRFPIDAIVAGRSFVKFHLDIGLGDHICEKEETVVGEDWLAFASIPPAIILTISKEQQFAEKLHAYTLPRNDRENTRVKDMVDMLLLILDAKMKPALLADNIRKVFQTRRTHLPPVDFPDPPINWERRYQLLVEECMLTEPFQQAVDIIRVYYQSLNDQFDMTINLEEVTL